MYFQQQTYLVLYVLLGIQKKLNAKWTPFSGFKVCEQSVLNQLT